MSTAGGRRLSQQVWALAVVLAFVGGVVLLATDFVVDEYTVGALLIALAAAPLHILIHELGHLLVALLVGLRVRDVRFSLTEPSAVIVKPGRPALAARMTALYLGGPLANFAVAALTWQLWRQPDLAVPMRVAASVATVIGVLIGLAELVPHRLTSVLHSDGWNILIWVLRPRFATASVLGDTAQMDRIIDSARRPMVLLAAYQRRLQMDDGEYNSVPVAERLHAIARDERTKRRHAAMIASSLAVQFGSGYLHMGIVGGHPVDRANADEIIEIAELAFRHRPRDVYARIGLAIARLIDHRPADARRLLSEARPGPHELYTTATQLYAIAEIYLGNRARAEALLARVGDDPMGEILAALRTAEVPPPLVQAPATSRDLGAGTVS